MYPKVEPLKAVCQFREYWLGNSAHQGQNSPSSRTLYQIREIDPREFGPCFSYFPFIVPPKKAWQSSWQVEPSAPALVGLMGM